MTFKPCFVFLLLLTMGLSACASNQPTEIPPTSTRPPKPTPTQMPLPKAATPTSAVPTSTNTPVVVASYTSQPPTDTPTVTPTGTETPTPAPTEEPTPISANSGTTMTIDWVDAAGKPDLITGVDEGLYIWNEGDKVYLRGITKGSRYTFQGQANAHGAIVNVDTLGENVNVTIGDDVSLLSFGWTTVGGPDGVNFSFSGDKLLLNLGIDSIPKPDTDLVFVGRDKHQVGLSIELIR